MHSIRGLWRLLPKRVRARFWDCYTRVYPYQKITYSGKVLAWGRDREESYRYVFPEPPSGKTVLDIGCHRGAYCFLAAAEGAAYCLGVDIDERRIRKGRALAAKRRVPNLEFIAADIRRYRIDRAYDVVLCLNLLQHMRNIEEVGHLLGQFLESAKERLILIAPLTVTLGVDHEYEFRGKSRYVLLSESYFRSKFGDRVKIRPLPSYCYGPNRALVMIDNFASFREK